MPVCDLGFPEMNPYTSTLIAAEAKIRELAPSVVISHEEFAAPAAAAIRGVPSIFIADWLPSAGSVAADGVAHADEIFIFERPGIFLEPDALRVKPKYIGPYARRASCSRHDRLQIRRTMHVEADAFVLMVAPGGFAGEAVAPIAQLIAPAFSQLPTKAKHMYWIGGGDFDHIQRVMSGVAGVTVVRETREIDRMMACSDVCVTRGTRATTLEAAALGVPTISLSHGQNPIDDLLASRIKSNLQLNARAVTPEILAAYLWERRSKDVIPEPTIDEGGVAKHLLDSISRLTASHPILSPGR